MDGALPGSRPGVVPAEVLSGEQSNTSLIFRPAGADPIICKVFRQLHPGLNPDIEVQSALSRGGSRHVPPAAGQLSARWSDPSIGAPVEGSLAFAQEFLTGAEDAWRVARRSAQAGESFAAAAYALGAATADVHLDLARLFPVSEPDATARADVTKAWRRRLGIAVAEVPALTHHQDAVDEVYDRASATRWPPLQRIHGDLHLGQVLQPPGRGWVLVDFEGEPMRPMSERRRPDCALRDVAGMLRSFDYVAASLAEDGTAPPSAWTRDARRAFLGGYENRTGTAASGPLLDAFELDKAIYEAIYETRNRPAWSAIPLSAVDRLLGAANSGLGDHPAVD